MKKFLDKFDKFLKIYLLFATFLLAFGLYSLYQKVDRISSFVLSPAAPNGEVQIQNANICGSDCKRQIQDAVSAAIATLSANTRTPAPRATSTPAPLVTKTQTVYIPLAGPVTTTSTDWVDVPGTDTYIDVINDYGKNAQVSWDAFLSVANNNGQAFGRLYDVTHGIVVNGSVVSTTNNAALQRVSSGSLNLWSGRNLYRVQIKSLNSFTVTFGSGRIKIVY